MSIIDRALQEINSKYGDSVTELIIDGKIKRTGKKEHIWYVGHEWDYKGQLYQSIEYGSWKFGDKSSVKSWDAKTESQKGFRQSLVKQTQEAKVKLDAETAEKHKNCKLKWGQIFKKAKPGIIHDYLKFKGIDNAYLSRVDSNGVLLIPVYNINGLVGCQRIFEDPETRKFDKRFSSGIEIKGGFCHLSPFKDAKYVYISEGFATAASIQMAYPFVPSICVFNAGNIASAVGMVRSINPDCKIIIAADKDQLDPRLKIKPGEHFAKKACQAYANVIYKLPSFPTDNPSWTDFNDLHQFQSLDAVRAQLVVTDTDFLTITPLGYMESDYFYTSNANNQIVRMPASAHGSKVNFLQLAPIDYWSKHFGVVDEDSGQVIISWVKVASDMMGNCHKKGLFNPEKVRGRGVWRDGAEFVINDGEKLNLTPKSSQYHYQKLIKADYSVLDPFTDDEMEELLSAFQNLHYKNPQDHMILAAWVVQAQIFACLPWRFHLWLTGQRGNGKSTIMEWMNNLLIDSLYTVNATAPGIRQDLKNDAKPTVFDETEPDAGKIKAVVELARQMSSNTGAKVVRGTSGGKAIVSNTQTVFLMGSIQVEQLQTQDVSRIFVVEIVPPKDQSTEEYEAIFERFKHFSDKKNRLFARVYNSIPAIITSWNLTRKYLIDKKMEARLADQLSTMISCFWVYTSVDPITEDAIAGIMEHYGLGKSEYVEANKLSDAEECFNDLMSVEVDRDSRTVAYCIEKFNNNPDGANLNELERYMGAMGIKYLKETNELFLASKSSKLSEKLRKFPSYASVLRRESSICTDPEARARIEIFRPNKVVAGIKIRLKGDK